MGSNPGKRTKSLLGFFSEVYFSIMLIKMRVAAKVDL